jgi:50S ribosomal subunit-associated GTPase HflX
MPILHQGFLECGRIRERQRIGMRGPGETEIETDRRIVDTY